MNTIMRVTYADHPCCQQARESKQRCFWEITRTDATGTTTYVTCTEHRDEAAASQSRYVGGWGDVTLTVRRVDVSESEEAWEGETAECRDGCGLDVDHEPPCREKPGGRVL